MSTQKAYLSVEGLRGLLALSVCLGHFGLGTLFERVGLQLNFHYAVDLFFVISGLVLARSNYFAAPSISTPLFLLKRMARLYPLHLITLLMMLGLNVFRGNSLNPQSLIENVFLIHNIGLSTFNNTFNFPSWSISVEICCTLIGFLLTQWVRKISTLTFILLAYVIFQSLYTPGIILRGDFETNFFTLVNAGMIRGLTGTFLGILLYLSLESKWGQKLFEIPLAGLFSALGISLYFFLNYSFTSILPFYLFSFFLVGACANNVPSLNLLRLKPCVWLGTISYSIYLLHIPLYTLLQTFLGDAFVKGFQGKLVLLPTLFVLSTLSYRWVEVPLQKQIRTLGFSFSKRKEYA